MQKARVPRRCPSAIMQNDSFKRGFRHVLITGETHMSQVQTQTQTQAPSILCRKFEYRNNIKFPGRTEHILVDTATWEILKPTRIERSRTRAHGADIYCLEQQRWSRVAVIALYRSNTGKLRWYIEAPEQIKRDLEELLMLASDFEDMVDTVHKYVQAKRLVM